MQNSENFTPRKGNRVVLFIDYKPAELRKGKDWLIVFYAKNPVTDKLERQRLRVPPLNNKKERERNAKKIIESINNRLYSGWSPFLESTENFYASFSSCTTLFLNRVQLDIKKGLKREDTLRAYKSYISMINRFIEETDFQMKFIIQFNKSFAINYLDWLLYDRNVGNETWNNHLNFLANFGSWLIEREYIKELPTLTLKRKPKQPKKRSVISRDDKQKLLACLQEEIFPFFLLCILTNLCLIRRTELTKLKVENVKMNKSIIVITGTASKTKKEEIVTIPDVVLPYLAKHLQDANNSDYLFSSNEFKPGKNKLQPKKISDTFTKYRKLLKLPENITFYSLKDTGITDLFNLGIPSFKIKNQARHSELRTTEIYAHKNLQADEDLRKIEINF